MTDVDLDPLAAVAALAEPTRRRLYEHVVRQPEPVGRDEAAAWAGLPRTTAAFHLDRLVEDGLLEVVFERRTGRTGPGAGRPAKLYRRSDRQFSVTLPARHYELAARLLAATVVEADRSGEPPRAVLDRRAAALGAQLGRGVTGREGALRVLEAYGFEPRTEQGTVALVNCPFHDLAGEQAELICGMNLHLLDGLLGAVPASGLTARLDPAPGHCCVRLEPSKNNIG